MNTIRTNLLELGVSEKAADVYEAIAQSISANDAKKGQEWEKNFNALIIEFSARKPKEEARQYFELQAKLYESTINLDSKAHQKAIDDLMNFFKEKSAVIA